MSSFEDNNDLRVTKRDGAMEIVAFDKILKRLKKIGKENIGGVENLKINYTTLAMKVIDQLFDGIHTTQIDELSAEQCASMASTHPDYNILAGRIVVSNHHKNTKSTFSETMEMLHLNQDMNGVGCSMISSSAFILSQKYAEQLDAMCDYERDYLIDYFGFKTLERSYLLKVNKRPIERPQHMWLRVSLGIHGKDMLQVKETYDYMSNKYFTHATPTLFNAGTPHQQLSSCYLIAMENDSIDGIYNTLKDCAVISKWAGGIGMHIHNVRASGSYIRGTGGSSNGIAPMLRVFNNTAKYVDQCFTPETILYTTRGPIPISQTISGITRIFNVDGTTEIVENVLEHVYDGKMLEIHIAGRDTPMRVTPEHLIMVLSIYREIEDVRVLHNELGSGLLQPGWIDAKYITPNDYIVHTIPDETCVRDFAELTEEMCYLYGKLLTSIENHEIVDTDEYETGAYNPRTYFYVRNTPEQMQDITDMFQKHCIPYITDKRDNSILVSWLKTVNLPFKTTDFWDPISENSHISERWLLLPKPKIQKILEGLNGYTGKSSKISGVDKMRVPLVGRGNQYRVRLLQSCIRFLQLRLGITQPGEVVFRNQLLIPVKSITETTYNGLVYDLKMTTRHNYLLENGIVHNGGGKRNGSFAIYLEPWHADIEMFLQMRKNHGDEELKARDLFYALWIPDLFMERVQTGGNWTLFCPDECPGLADVYGDAFVKLYTKYEHSGKGRKTMLARDLWFQMLDAQMETGTPYMLYKDACNRKSNQQNLGTIKSSNLCSEIVQYSDGNETAVCNLASMALPMFVNVETRMFDYDMLHKVVKVVIRNLNKVIDVNYYPTEKTRVSNMLHRPVGLGVQGLADVFMMLNLPFQSDQSKEINRLIFETIYHASMETTNEIAKERYEAHHAHFEQQKTEANPDHLFTKEEYVKLHGTVCGAYSSFIGSPTSNGVFQFDLWNITPSDRYDWETLRASVKQYGIRNSLLIAPMPTASTSQILGFNECIEPITSNIYSRRTLAGEFIMANKYLMNDLIQLNLWNEQIKNNIIANNGSVQQIEAIPIEIREKYKTVWEIPMRHLIDMASDRGAFICQSQSLNLWLEDPNYNTLTSMHFYSWKKGLKTGIYYLRRRGKHQAQQFTIEPEKKTQEDEHEICEMCSS
jgi:ribonucleotide reductase alpha subunit